MRVRSDCPRYNGQTSVAILGSSPRDIRHLLLSLVLTFVTVFLREVLDPWVTREPHRLPFHARATRAAAVVGRAPVPNQEVGSESHIRWPVRAVCRRPGRCGSDVAPFAPGSARGGAPPQGLVGSSARATACRRAEGAKRSAVLQDASPTSPFEGARRCRTDDACARETSS
jgi:hypothetical protein